MKGIGLLIPAMAVAAVTGASTSHAALIAKWTFEGLSVSSTAGNVPVPTVGSLAADIGIGTAAAFHSSAATVWSTPVGNGSAKSLSSNNWSQNDYFEFKTTTIGSATLFFGFDQTRSSTGPGQFQLEYSTNLGATFTPLPGGAYTVLANASPNPTWNSTTQSPIYTTIFDLSSVGANLPDFRVRLTQTATGIATAGTNRVDNVVFAETAAEIPEPAGFGLVAGVLALTRRRRA